jgi:thiosulfate dehydrogenase [quinone] large subunit
MNTYSTREKIMGFIRLALGWVFLWPFLDKLFGLGFATEIGKGWIVGNSPTLGFLSYGTRGPFAEIFQSLAGTLLVDWFFMIGLLFIGLALIFGVFIRIAAYSGSLILLLMWLAAMPPEHNPFIDDHIIYTLMLIALTVVPSDYLSFGRKWKQLGFISKHPILK